MDIADVSRMLDLMKEGDAGIGVLCTREAIKEIINTLDETCTRKVLRQARRENARGGNIGHFNVDVAEVFGNSRRYVQKPRDGRISEGEVSGNCLRYVRITAHWTDIAMGTHRLSCLAAVLGGSGPYCVGKTICFMACEASTLTGGTRRR